MLCCACRVGSLQRIAKPVLPHALHCADDNRDAISALNDMLQGADKADGGACGGMSCEEAAIVRY